MSVAKVKLNGGITLMEVILVVSLIGILAGLTMSTNIDSFRGYSFRNDREILINSLQRARSQAINNICLATSCAGGMSHGVHFSTGKYTIFEGNSYTAADVTNEDINVNSAMVITGPTDVIFAQLTGDASTTPSNTWNINITDNAGHNSIITINTEGQIKWTN